MSENEKKPLTEKQAMKKALRRGTRYRVLPVNMGVTILAVMFAVIISLCTVVLILRGDGRGEPVKGTGIGSGTDALVSDVVTEAPSGKEIVLSADDVYTGELILINADHKYVFPDTPIDVSVYDNKDTSYKVADKNVTLSMTSLIPFNKLMNDFYAETGCRDVMIVSGGGYRSEEYQRQIYDNRVATQGAEMAAKYVALPGHSEHHSGLAMDLTVYTDAGEGHTLRTYEKCEWLVENFENYGFILRYPEEKASITGINYESWHYRYVGVPHSLIMKEMDFCLEEYVEYLQNLPEDKAVSWNGISSEEVSLDGMCGDYTVYYVPANESGDTTITLPEGRGYTVSGDNVGGFIITLLPIDGGEANE